MGEINADDKFGAYIIDIVKALNLKTNLEIGSWDGTGATRCFIEGMKDFPEKSLTCLEIVKEKYDNLVKNVFEYPWVKCYNKSSIDCSKLIDFKFERIWDSPFNPLKQFPDNDKETLERYYNEDVDLMKKFPNGFLESDKTMYDSVLIDGSEFTGFFEFELLKDRTNVLFLDDTFRSYKTNKVAILLAEDLDWDCVAFEKNVEAIDWGLDLSSEDGTVRISQDILDAMSEHRRNTRNGFAIFKRKKFLEHE
tara:strand:+ start:3745 stop:4497 length:753 start_codon:yes stop_codon:yes gene_type:complete